MAKFCVCDNDPLGSIKCGGFLDQLRACDEGPSCMGISYYSGVQWLLVVQGFKIITVEHRSSHSAVVTLVGGLKLHPGS